MLGACANYLHRVSAMFVNYSLLLHKISGNNLLQTVAARLNDWYFIDWQMRGGKILPFKM